MSFSDTLKWRVKQNAHFYCCWCQNVKGSLDAHHIVPESEGGPDTENNAAPLCKECHDTFGSNPNKRTEVRKRRDWWYDQCAKQSLINQRLDELYIVLTDPVSGFIAKIDRIESITLGLASQKSQIISRLNYASPEEIPSIMTDLATASGTLTVVSNAITHLSDYISVQCPNCKTETMVLASNTFQVCPNCRFVLKGSR